MLNITFKGQPFVLFSNSLDESGAIASMADYRAGNQSYAHYYTENGGYVNRFGQRIGGRDDIIVVEPAEKPIMTAGESLAALRNMLSWVGKVS